VTACGEDKLKHVPQDRSFEIRPFLRRHLERVLEIERVCFDRDAYPRDLFLDLYRESAGLFFIARRSRRIVGYSLTCPSGLGAELVSIAVAPEHRAAGVGKALLRHTFSRLRPRRIRTLVLTVRPANLAALRLYRRLGFRAAGRIPRYYEDRSDGLLMRKQL
jgi:[ribosomal protein S18]-alanine N-acetyltransferase